MDFFLNKQTLSVEFFCQCNIFSQNYFHNDTQFDKINLHGAGKQYKWLNMGGGHKLWTFVENVKVKYVEVLESLESLHLWEREF